MRFIGLLLIVFAIIGCASSENEITVYQLRCTNYNNGMCEGKWIDHGYTVFKLSKAWEAVYYYTSSQPQYEDTPHRLNQCEILDVENWKCLNSFGHAWQMKDGQFYDSYNDGSIKNVSWFRYWRVRYLPLIIFSFAGIFFIICILTSNLIFRKALKLLSHNAKADLDGLRFSGYYTIAIIIIGLAWLLMRKYFSDYVFIFLIIINTLFLFVLINSTSSILRKLYSMNFPKPFIKQYRLSSYIFNIGFISILILLIIFQLLF